MKYNEENIDNIETVTIHINELNTTIYSRYLEIIINQETDVVVTESGIDRENGYSIN